MSWKISFAFLYGKSSFAEKPYGGKYVQFVNSILKTGNDNL